MGILLWQKLRIQWFFKNMWTRTEPNNYKLKIYVYNNLPKTMRPSKELPLVSETYFYIYKLIKKNYLVKDPNKANLFFVPINLIQYQFANRDPQDMLKYLSYLSKKKDHVLIALGDFSNRGHKNHFGEAYQEPYKWLDKFCLLALESTSDLNAVHDIGIIPINTLTAKPEYNTNLRPYLYSFLGELQHTYLPKNHIRSRIANLEIAPDVFIASEVGKVLRKDLRKNYSTRNDFELISRNSIFTLAPAGYGRWTYRFYQSISWGSIPVLISDDYIKPFGKYIPYDDFCITIKESELKNLDSILRSIPNKEIEFYQNNLRNNQKLFTKDSFKELLDKELQRIAKNARK